MSDNSKELHERLVHMVTSTEDSIAENFQRFDAGEETDSEGSDIYDALNEVYGVTRREELSFCLAGGGPSMFLNVTRDPETREVEYVQILANWSGIEPVERDYFPGHAIWRWAEFLSEGIE